MAQSESGDAFAYLMPAAQSPKQSANNASHRTVSVEFSQVDLAPSTFIALGNKSGEWPVKRAGAKT